MSRSAHVATGLVAVVVLVVVGLVWAGTHNDPPARHGLAQRLADTGLALYLPDLHGARVRRTTITGDGAVVSDFDIPRKPFVDEQEFYLEQRPVPRGDLCRAFTNDPEDDCHERDGVVRTTFEEMSTAAVVRGRTLLVFQSLRTEDDPHLLDDAVRALQRAPEVSPDQLARR